MPRQELILHPVLGERLTLEGLAAEAGLHPGLVEQLVEYGLVEQVGAKEAGVCFHASSVGRLRTIRHLREDLGINLPGIAVALDLLERIEALAREVKRLRRPER